jgi:signal transducing adaptor molecule
VETLCVPEHVNAMGPLIDQELEKVDRKHAQLTQLSSDLVEALNLYHTLMREPAAPQSYHAMPKQMNYSYSLPPSAQVCLLACHGKHFVVRTVIIDIIRAGDIM